MFNMTYTCSDQAVGGQENKLNNSHKDHLTPLWGGGKKGIKSRLTKISFQLSSPYKKTIPGCYLFNSLSCINHRAVLNPTYKCSDQTAGGTGGTGGTNGPCV